MPRATQQNGGKLIALDQCSLHIPGAMTIKVNNLPDISDSKSASFAGENVMGRASPIVTYSYSEARSLSITFHFIAVTKSDLETNMKYLRAIQSCVYPRNSQGSLPYLPPPVCTFKCGKLLSDDGSLCVICKNYNVKFPTDVAWEVGSYIPYKFDVDTSWDVVYVSSNLPGSERIFEKGA